MTTAEQLNKKVKDMFSNDASLTRIDKHGNRFIIDTREGYININDIEALKKIKFDTKTIWISSNGYITITGCLE